MKKNITVYCKNTKRYYEIPIGTSVLEFYHQLGITLPYQTVAARVNYKVEDLNFLIYTPKDIEFIDLSTPSGMRIYVRTLSMVIAKAIDDLYPQGELRIEHPIARGYYCTVNNLKEPLTEDVIQKIQERAKEIIDANRPIIRQEKQAKMVKDIFKDKSKVKVSLFDTIGNPYIRYSQLDDFVDYYSGVLLPSTGYLNIFELSKFQQGVFLRIPDRKNPVVLERAERQAKTFEIFEEFVEWTRIIGISNVGEFNMACRSRNLFNLIKISEALHEKKVAAIADMIKDKGHRKVKFVLISGPSSSGKTTFSKRLSIQLTVNALKPIAVSMDNYFVNRVDTPLDENGEWDFECIDAMDRKLFNEHLKALLAGEEVEVPFFNFETGEREYRGNKIQLGEDNILILEGIHALNPDLMPDIDPEKVFKVYVSALTTISIDNHNWIPTTDTRLLRRIIRDYRYRNFSARETIARWDSVRRGEEKWIFPFQENADVMFNSALLFELPVLKKHAGPILAEVPKYCDEYTEAHRLRRFLSYFVPIPENEIPPTSLLREFVGGSSFHY